MEPLPWARLCSVLLTHVSFKIRGQCLHDADPGVERTDQSGLLEYSAHVLRLLQQNTTLWVS